MKYLLAAAAVVTVIALGLWIEVQSHPPAVRPERPSGPMSIYAPGRVEGVTEEVALRPQLAGLIERVAIAEGQSVEAQTVLVELDAAEYRQQVALAQAELELAQAKLDRTVNGARQQERDEAQAMYESELAKLEKVRLAWERSQKLFQSNAVARKELDDHRTGLASAEAEVKAAKAKLDLINAPARDDEIRMGQAQVAAAQARLELANVQLERTRLRAPSSGEILRVNIEPGEMTGPESTEAPIIFADTSRHRVRAFVEEIDAPRVTTGMIATITADGLPGAIYTGRVTRLSPRMSRKQLFTDDPAEHYDTKVREVWIEIEDPSPQLVIGLRVDVRIASD